VFSFALETTLPEAVEYVLSVPASTTPHGNSWFSSYRSALASSFGVFSSNSSTPRCCANNVRSSKAEKAASIVEDLVSFANYGFPEAHASHGLVLHLQGQLPQARQHEEYAKALAEA